MLLNKKLGQYFTTNINLKEKMFALILNDPIVILEPSIGRGDLVEFITSKTNLVEFDLYEIDDKIEVLDTIDKTKVIYCDFLKESIKKTYKTIVGNPPYVRTNTGNLYLDFTKKCFDLLEYNGELLFIVPSDFLKLTSAAKLLDEMMLVGTFTHIYHPHTEKMFENASVDIILFRYCKNTLLEKKVLYNDKLQYITNSNGMITFTSDRNEDNFMFKDYFNIYVGIVSGKDDFFKNQVYGNIDVLNGYEKKEKYICINEFPTLNKELDSYFLDNKELLMGRGIRKFSEKNWFEWGALRNISAIRKNMGSECIYLYNLTRKEKIAFSGEIGYFGGSLLMLKPKKKMDLTNIISYLNSDNFKNNFLFSGRFKIGHRQISNSFLPNNILKNSKIKI